MTMTRAAAVLAAVAALAGCTTPPSRSDPVTPGFGETTSVGPLRVTPLALLEDSRCPLAVRCVWAGRVRITVRIDGNNGELTLGQPAPVAGGALMLAQVEPAKRPDRDLPPSEYRFRFHFEPGR